MEKKYSVFGVDAYTTVLQDKPFSRFLKKEASIIVNPLINGHDAYQIVIQANEAIKNYAVSISCLQNEKGETLDEQFIEIYNCKYTLVKTNVERFYGFGEGYYPNAILPMEKAVEYGENNVGEGHNQSIYFSFYIPENMAPGIYRGDFLLVIDGEEIAIPVKVNVRNVAIPKESHLRSLFLIEWDWHGPSKVRDFAKYQRYIRLLTKYRLNVSTLIPYPHNQELGNLYGAKADTLEKLYAFHADLAYEYCLNPLHTTFSVPYKNWIKKREIEGGIKGAQSEYLMGLECDVFENFLSALIKKSLETKFDIIKRAVLYFGRFIDEPQGQGTMDRLEQTNKDYHEVLDRLSQDLLDKIDKYTSEYSVDKAFIAEVAHSVKYMPHIITTHYHDEEYDAFIDTYCPLFWFLQEEDSFDKYAHKQEKWWYGCNGPTSPCPTYHLDDHLLSPRILSWLQYKYGYIGNLYWAINCYNYQNPGQHPYYDFYNEIQWSGHVNLDGLLSYPGEIYGMDENVATLRMEEIRAGMEDYEFLYALGNAYEKRGVSFKETFAYYLNFMSRGIKIVGENEIFAKVRTLFLDLYELHFETGLCVCDLKEEENVLYGKIFLDEGYNLSCNGEEMSCKCVDGVLVYEFAIPTVNARFTISGNNLQRTFCLGNFVSRVVIEPKTLLNYVSNVDADMEFVDDGKQGIRLIAPTAKGLIQTFKLVMPEGVDLTNAVALLLNFDNQKDDKKFEGINIQAKFKNEKELRSMISQDTWMPPLKNTMPVYLAQNDWAKSGDLEYLLISFGEDNEEYKRLSKKTPVKKYIWIRDVEVLYKR